MLAELPLKKQLKEVFQKKEMVKEGILKHEGKKGKTTKGIEIRLCKIDDSPQGFYKTGH